MSLQKQNIAIPFSVSLGQKTDDLQNPPANMQALVNALYTKDKKLTKRNGYKILTSLPASSNVTGLTTFNNNLTALGNNVYAYSTASQQWINHGRYQPVRLSVEPMVRSALSQVEVDSAVSANNLICTVYKDTALRYQITDANGQVLVPSVAIPNSASNGRVIVIGNFFVITFTSTVTATPHLQYIAVPLANLTNPTAPVDISTQVKANPTGYDVFVVGSFWAVAWNASDGGGAIRLATFNSNLAPQSVHTLVGEVGDLISVVADSSGSSPVIWLSYYTSSSTSWKVATFSQILNAILAPTLIDNTKTLITIAGSATAGVFSGLAEVQNSYGFAGGPRSDYVEKASVTSAGVVTGPSVLVRSVGLASKVFTYNSVNYFMTAYGGALEPTYFLMDQAGNCISRLAFSNAGGYVSNNILPAPWMIGSKVSIAYLIKDLLVSVAKTTNITPNNAPSNIYTQDGCNLATFDMAVVNPVSVEIGNGLYMAGGFLWMYDGSQTSEQGFHLWPEDVTLTNSSFTGGNLGNEKFFYQAIYAWTDAQGNIHRSAPSVPVEADLSSSVTGTNKVDVNVPTDRITYKTNARIEIYRWSTAQQNYFLITSISSPLLNDTSIDYVTFTDTLADSSILGNPLLYTTGGVVENIAGPACSALALYKSRLFLADSEDLNLLWYSKQVIEGTPVETSDLFTEFVAPTTGVQSSTGPTLALSAMDDKLIAFKANAMYYLVGLGPDNTGADNDLTDPVYISSTVGTSNEQSIAFIPLGIMFQSSKGVWLLGRDLSTQYIGADVEDLALSNSVTTTIVPSGTNHVRLCLSDGQVLMYDYYFSRWGTFDNINAVSGTSFQELHTYLDKYGRVFQETPGLYLDGVRPVLMSFTTSWLNLAGLQGFQRAYMMYLLGEYASPHTLALQVAYDYEDGPTQSLVLTPSQVYSTWGSDPYWGDGSVWGDTSSLEQFRVFLNRQKMQAFQLSLQEQYDPSQGVAAGAGLSLSGLNMVVGVKKGFVPLPASQSAG